MQKSFFNNGTRNWRGEMMKNTKKFVTVLLAASMLAACNSKEEKTEEPVEQKEVVKIEIAAEAEAFKKYIEDQMDDFVQDTKILAALVKDGKLEDAQKLYPLVTMYYERMQPLTANFKELDAKINTPLIEGKEAEGTGFARLAYGLFNEKKTVGYEDVADQLAKDVTELQTQLPSIDVTENNVLAATVTMLEQFATERLANSSDANNEVYVARAQTEVAEQVVKIFMNRTTTESAAKATEQIATLNEVIAYFEVGKEDYVNYSFFTSKQKEELTTAVNSVVAALQQMNEELK